MLRTVGPHIRAVRSSAEDDRAPTADQHTALAVSLDGAGEHLGLDIAADGDQLVGVARVVHADDFLFDDRAFVEVGRDVVRRGPDELHAALMCQDVRPGSLETRQEGVVDVDGPAVELLAR